MDQSYTGQSIYNGYNSSHNPNVGLHPRAGYNTRPASQSKMVTIQGWPVSQRWLQYKTGQSVKYGYNTQPASQSTMRFIFNTGLASQFMMGTIQSGQLVKDGYNKLTGQSV
jgi:hypothetical protein